MLFADGALIQIDHLTVEAVAAGIIATAITGGFTIAGKMIVSYLRSADRLKQLEDTSNFLKSEANKNEQMRIENAKASMAQTQAMQELVRQIEPKKTQELAEAIAARIKLDS